MMSYIILESKKVLALATDLLLLYFIVRDSKSRFACLFGLVVSLMFYSIRRSSILAYVQTLHIGSGFDPAESNE